MDENKNWVNWQHYNPDRGIEHIYSIANSAASYTSHITTTVEGLYIVLTSCWNNNATITPDSNGSLVTIAGPSNSGIKVALIYANKNSTITTTTGTSTGDTVQGHSYYLIRGYTSSTALNIQTYHGTGAYTVTNGYTSNSIGNFMFGIAAPWNSTTFTFENNFTGGLFKSNTYNVSSKYCYSFVAIPDSEVASCTFRNSSGYKQMGVGYGKLI